MRPPSFIRKPPPAGSPLWKLWDAFVALHVRAYRLTGGRVGGRAMGAPVLLLDHVGRKSRKRRTSPLLCFEDGDDVVIVASKGGSPKNPAWFHNLTANPDTTVQIAGQKRQVSARRAGPEERPRLWERAVEVYPTYASYQAHTEREIPVVILSPR